MWLGLRPIHGSFQRESTRQGTLEHGPPEHGPLEHGPLEQAAFIVHIETLDDDGSWPRCAAAGRLTSAVSRLGSVLKSSKNV